MSATESAPRSASSQGSGLVRWLTSAPPLAFLTIFFLVPSLIMVGASFRFPGELGALAPLFGPGAEGEETGLTLENYQVFLGDTIYVQIFVKSFGVAALTTLACLVMAYPVALLIARSPKRHRNLLVLLCVLPFASNFLVRVYAWMIILGPFDLLFSRLAVLVGMVYVHLPFMILPLYTNLEKHDPTLLDAAQDLGASAWNRFWRVTFPLSLPGIFSGSALVFIPVLGMFAIPEILGGKDDWLVGNLIKESFLGTRDWPFGSMLSLMLTFAVLAIAGLAAWLARRGVARA
ncbi:MAG: ABC transporter permease [Burkholderiales bacterium]|nr:ABC transporter permease [Burkholderiales bacterium]MCC7114402.1 ABC transporter permease [Burkholderiales bacterium]